MSQAVRFAWVALLALLCVLVTVEWRGRIQPRMHDQYVRDIRELEALDARLSSQVMQSRQALVAHYDDVVRTAALVTAVEGRLAVPPAYLSLPEQKEISVRAAASRATQDQKQEAIESFKSQNAVLRTSIRFFPVAAEDLLVSLEGRPDVAELERRVRELLTAVLRFIQLPDSSVDRERVQLALDELTTEPAPPELVPGVMVVQRHARAVLERGVRVDELTSEILAFPTVDRALELDAFYQRAHQGALRGAERRRSGIFGVALLAVALLAADIILRLRRSARSERAANAVLAQANEALSRERERERELSDMKSGFVSMASHEFRTPLAVILSSSELIEAYGERWTPAKRADHFSRIKTSIRGMTDLLDGILVIGKSEAGRLVCKPAPFDVQRHARQLAESFQQTVGPKHDFSVDIEVEPVDAWMDEKLLNHILQNLLSNAFKYSPDGGTVRFSVRCTAAAATFVVSDEGIGIPDSDKARMFESFHRGGNVGAIPGTGLGLAVVKRAVDAHGGTLDVGAGEAGGTVFTVTIPITEPGEASEPADASAAA